MKHSENRRTNALSFSYIDIFFLLLAGLILSFGIGFFAEMRQETRSESYQVYLTVPMEEVLKNVVPMAGDVLYGEDGETCGRVLTVSVEEVANKRNLKIKCRLKGKRPNVGDELMIETPDCVRKMQVYLVETDDR